MTEKVYSPLTLLPARHIKSVSLSKLRNLYEYRYGYSFSNAIIPENDVEVWECLQTGYRFYYPYNLAGDSSFYEFFQKFDWYYMPWKWEHDLSVGIIEKLETKNVLEIGCASGAFLSLLKSRFSGINLTGLELNNDAVSKANSNGLNVKAELVEFFSELNENEYDLVCSFQVLEHISNPKSFLEASIKCLKIGGKLIICVPNNKSFIKFEDSEPLNYPPHHMGLWNEDSLINLTKIFNLKLDSVHFEPVQVYHFDWYLRVILKKYLLFDLLSKAVFKILKFSGFLPLLKPIILKQKGHSVLVIFEKV